MVTKVLIIHASQGVAIMNIIQLIFDLYETKRGLYGGSLSKYIPKN